MVGDPLFEIEDLHVSAVGSGAEPAVELLRGLSLAVGPGQLHAVVDRAGASASALARVVLGSTGHVVTGGRILFRGDDITRWPTDIRARAGLFLAFGCPCQIPGVSILHLVSRAVRARRGPETDLAELRETIAEWMGSLAIDPSLIDRPFVHGLSIEEKRTVELVQLAVLQPEMAVVDLIGRRSGRRITSGAPESGAAPAADDRAGPGIAARLRTVRTRTPALGTLAMTDDLRLLEHLQPDLVHVLVDGRIAESGTPESALRLEALGHGNHL